MRTRSRLSANQSEAAAERMTGHFDRRPGIRRGDGLIELNRHERLRRCRAARPESVAVRHVAAAGVRCRAEWTIRATVSDDDRTIGELVGDRIESCDVLRTTLIRTRHAYDRGIADHCSNSSGVDAEINIRAIAPVICIHRK